MTDERDQDAASAGSRGELLVAFDATTASERLVRTGERLAQGLDLPFTVLFVETPGPTGAEEPAEVLAIAARLGATVAKAPATDLAAGAAAHVGMSPVAHLVLPAPAGDAAGRPWNRRGTQALAGFAANVDLTLVATERSRASPRRVLASVRSGSAVGYAAALLATLASVPVLLLLRGLFGGQALGFLFVFPVLGVASRFGIGAALTSALLSTICYDLLVLRPHERFGVVAPQDVVVATALVIVAVYASALTARLRERVALSDRSAQENAGLAAFGANLARVSDWEGTGALVCAEVARMFSVRSAVFREHDGRLVLVAAEPADAQFGPVDRTALDWAWQEGEAAGSGTGTAAASDWQFQPLSTSLGTLAVLAVARDDGRPPIAESRKLLFSTLSAQAALAHERLRLEDSLRAAPATAMSEGDPHA